MHRLGMGAASIASNTTTHVASAAAAALPSAALASAAPIATVIATITVAAVATSLAASCAVAFHARGGADGALGQDQLLRCHHHERIHAGALPHLLPSDESVWRWLRSAGVCLRGG